MGAEVWKKKVRIGWVGRLNGKLKRDRIYRVKAERESIRVEGWECAYKGNRGRRIGEEGITEIK